MKKTKIAAKAEEMNDRMENTSFEWFSSYSLSSSYVLRI
jgi:hypothetical protein